MLLERHGKQLPVPYMHMKTLGGGAPSVNCLRLWYAIQGGTCGLDQVDGPSRSKNCPGHEGDVQLEANAVHG